MEPPSPASPPHGRTPPVTMSRPVVLAITTQAAPMPYRRPSSGAYPMIVAPRGWRQRGEFRGCVAAVAGGEAGLSCRDLLTAIRARENVEAALVPAGVGSAE